MVGYLFVLIKLHELSPFWFLLFFVELYTVDRWEIDKDAITLEKSIGHGHFGQVFQGLLRLSDGTLKPCAVKVMCELFEIKFILIPFFPIKVRTAHPNNLLQEASIMKSVSNYH